MVNETLSDHQDGTVLAVVAVPRSGKTGIDRIAAGAVRVRVTAAPVDGAANAALLRYLADVLDRPRGSLRLLSGETSRHKRVLIGGLSRPELAARLAPLIDRPLKP
ncbi:MAG: DUF167 domain-containing protein [Chloroflexota bacterium]|nr:DUF167 domain-containing protein [Chloroflexota bacterium]